MGGVLSVEGVATCDEGHARLRLYEGEGGAFLRVAGGFIEGHTYHWPWRVKNAQANHQRWRNL